MGFKLTLKGKYGAYARIEVAFGADQDVYLKTILSDPLPLP